MQLDALGRWLMLAYGGLSHGLCFINLQHAVQSQLPTVHECSSTRSAPSRSLVESLACSFKATPVTRESICQSACPSSVVSVSVGGAPNVQRHDSCSCRSCYNFANSVSSRFQVSRPKGMKASMHCVTWPRHFLPRSQGGPDICQVLTWVFYDQLAHALGSTSFRHGHYLKHGTPRITPKIGLFLDHKSPILRCPYVKKPLHGHSDTRFQEIRSTIMKIDSLIKHDQQPNY